MGRRSVSVEVAGRTVIRGRPVQAFVFTTWVRIAGPPAPGMSDLVLFREVQYFTLN